MAQKIQKASNNVVKILNILDDFLLKCGNKIL